MNPLVFLSAFVVATVYGQTALTQVSFSAGLTHDLTLTHAETVMFDKVFVNIGNGYDTATGIFTCPTPGIYNFEVHTLTHQDKAAWLELYKNGDYEMSLYGHSSNDYASAGNAIILRLDKGDTVYVKAVDPQYGDDTNIYGQPDEIYTTFSGNLIAHVSSEITPVGK